MPLRDGKTEGRKRNRPNTRKDRPTASKNRSSPAAVTATSASSASISLSESESDIERVSQKANALLGSFLSFKDRGDCTSTESNSRSSSVIPAKRPAEPNGTSTTSERSNERDNNTIRPSSLAQPLSDRPVSWGASSPLRPVVEIPIHFATPQQPGAAGRPTDRPSSQSSKRLRRAKKKILKKEKPFLSDRIESPISTESRSSRRNRGPRSYYASTLEISSPRDQTEQNHPADELSASSTLTSEPKNLPGRVCYRSATHIVVKEPLVESASNLASYRSWEEREDPESLLKTRRGTNIGCKGILLHADLCMDELNVFYRFMTNVETTQTEGCIQDLVVQYSQLLFDCGEIASLLRKLARLKDVYLALSGYTSNIAEFLLGCRNGELAQQIKSDKKLVVICQYLKEKFLVSAPIPNNDINAHLKFLLRQVDEQKLRAAAQEISILGQRTSNEFCAFLADAKNGRLPTSPSALRAYSSKPDQHLLRYYPTSVASHLRARELGYQQYKARSSIQQTLVKSANDSWEHWKSWEGASKDVVVLDWSPDGTRFVAGCATSCAPENMMYNRRNNLVVGDLTTNRLKELPDHRMPRVLFDPTQANEESSGSDPQLYTSISAVAWSNDGTRMFSSSYDRTVKLWDTSNHQDTRCITTLRHPGKVLVMALSKVDNCRLATGSDRENSFLLWQVEQEHGLSLSSPLEISPRHNKLMTPTSLAWGPNSYTKDLLVAGMSLPDSSDTRDPPIGGHLAVWRMEEASVTQLGVMPNSQNVFDLSWHLPSGLFAAGIAAYGRSKGLGSEVRSMVNIYDPLRGKRDIISYDCPGRDINIVTFCPFNDNYISAGCTNGTTYVWDFRNPNKILHQLQHGPQIRDLDIGVQFGLWGDQSSMLYTGSSDGCVKTWNIMAATEDVFVKDLASFGNDITSGALSADKTTMIIGDNSGSIHILSTSTPPDDDKSMRFEHAKDEPAYESDSGVRAANELIESGQIVKHEKYGPGKGPKYNGPYAAWARPPGTPADKLSSTPLMTQVQMEQLYGSATKRREYLDEDTRKKVRTQIQLAKFRNSKTYWAASGSSINAGEGYA
ncbi:hypothetical protein MGYG_02408 [Nannizzia gypsea CBS 118893]|uniref:WD repeat-containing protein n=1 Tax=Arthroderma gypseum (strain ATCC MYA-4604 / CBS 118893) TaxID=535722 RepID=E4URH4_ARTGP|nr:hypothetical protein MGYG_02408 [Nannizzia gypsea CBS 118893]EFQ99396.1 hypothetical protein MGYG_02408 [Nannizzia gypsea CBS 118893]